MPLTENTVAALAEAVDDLRRRASGVADSIAAAHEESDEDDTDSLKVYEAGEIIDGLRGQITNAHDNLATFIGLKRLASESATL